MAGSLSYIINCYDKDSLFSGGIVFVIAFMIFLISYLMMAKTMKSLMYSSLQEKHTKYLHKDVPYLPWLTPYLWLVAGAGVTVLVQSSSIVTASLVPLVSSQIMTLGGTIYQYSAAKAA